MGVFITFTMSQSSMTVRWFRSPRSRERTVGLIIIESPYRETVGPLVNYIEELQRMSTGLTVSVVLPEFVPAHLYELLLHNQTALRLKFALWTHPEVVVVNVPYHLSR